MRLESILFTVTLIVGLSGCGGSGRGSSPGPSSQPDTAALNGIYQGQFSQDGLGTFDLTALIQDGRIFALSEGAQTIYDGSVGATNNDFSGNATVYDIGGGVADSVTLQGVFTPQNSVDGSFAGDSGSSGSIALDYDVLYERDSNLSLLNDVWSFSDGNFTVTVTIGPDGNFSGSDTDGCVYSGDIDIIDSDFNSYSQQFTASSCGSLNGEYSGFVVLSDDQQTNDTMVVTGSSPDFIFVYTFARQ